MPPQAFFGRGAEKRSDPFGRQAAAVRDANRSKVAFGRLVERQRNQLNWCQRWDTFLIWRGLFFFVFSFSLPLFISLDGCPPHPISPSATHPRQSLAHRRAPRLFSATMTWDPRKLAALKLLRRLGSSAVPRMFRGVRGEVLAGRSAGIKGKELEPQGVCRDSFSTCRAAGWEGGLRGAKVPQEFG